MMAAETVGTTLMKKTAHQRNQKFPHKAAVRLHVILINLHVMGIANALIKIKGVIVIKIVQMGQMREAAHQVDKQMLVMPVDLIVVRIGSLVMTIGDVSMKVGGVMVVKTVWTIQMNTIAHQKETLGLTG